MLAIDQLLPERLSDGMPGGLGRLQREGRSFVDAELLHAFTETCPGHATMLTGQHPARIGIPGNSYIDPGTLERRYCVEDRAPDAAMLGVAGVPADGRSPRALQVGTLGDWMKSQRAGTRVFSVSGKDRSAITMGGRDADAAYWLERGESPRFVTSRFYMNALPDWVSAWGPEKVLAALPNVWEYLPESIAASAAASASAEIGRVDDYAYETRTFGRTAPHPVLLDPPGLELIPVQLRNPAARMYATPFADQVTLAFATELVERENLGGGPQTDLLAVGLSATDVVGHVYGPESWESRDALARLDIAVGEFLAFLEARVGVGRVLVALTADHGVLPIPEWIQETGRSHCKLPRGRLSAAALVAELNAHLDDLFGSLEEAPKDPKEAARAKWFVSVSSRLTLNQKRAGQSGVSPERIVAAARVHLEAADGIAHAWTRSNVLSGAGPEPLVTYYRNSWAPKLAGDIALQADEDCLLGDGPLATSHGSPYGYDRRVPLIFFGPGIAPGRVEGEAATVDIAPTLAGLLHIEVPEDLAGRALPLR